MVSIRTLLLLAMLPLLLSGCGFQPLYGKRSSLDLPAELNRITIANIPDHNGQMLRNRLMDRLYSAGRPDDPAYILTVGLTEQEIGLGVRRDATTARTSLEVSANYVLTQKGSGKTILNGVAKTSVSYNDLDAQFATLTARENANERALNEVGEQIVNRLALHFGTTPTMPSKTP